MLENSRAGLSVYINDCVQLCPFLDAESIQQQSLARGKGKCICKFILQQECFIRASGFKPLSADVANINYKSHCLFFFFQCEKYWSGLKNTTSRVGKGKIFL